LVVACSTNNHCISKLKNGYAYIHPRGTHADTCFLKIISPHTLLDGIVTTFHYILILDSFEVQLQLHTLHTIPPSLYESGLSLIGHIHKVQVTSSKRGHKKILIRFFLAASKSWIGTWPKSNGKTMKVYSLILQYKDAASSVHVTTSLI
jgi:hypothetical protein